MSSASVKGDRSFGKSVRLKGRTDFLETIRGSESRKLRGAYCSIFVAGSNEGSTRFGISISRKVGNAVRRNRLKRVIREYLRNNKPLWPKGRRIVISLSSPVEDEQRLTAEIGEMADPVIQPECPGNCSPKSKPGCTNGCPNKGLQHKRFRLRLKQCKNR